MQWPPTRPSDARAGVTEPSDPDCPGDEALFSLALGELPRSEQGTIEEHVRSCADCREILSEALRSLGGETQSRAGSGGATEVLLDRYELREPIGSGGAGVVYRAYDPALKREVAVKILRPDLPGSREAFQIRLRSEAQATAQLSHPNVVTAYDVGATESGGFIVLEYFSGGTLQDWLHREHPLDERLRVLCEAGNGLAAAHEKGLVHRDFKPQNVLMSEDGRVCVTDFGLARLEETGNLRGFQMDSTLEDATQTRGLMGTPNYMAPEVFAGARGDEKSDQFSFCVALFQAMNGGRHPFRGARDTTLSELLTRMKSGLIEAPTPGVPEHISQAIKRGLSADPADRYASMKELLAALRQKPHPGLSKGAMALLAVLFTGLVVALLFFLQAREAARSTEPSAEPAAKSGQVEAPVSHVAKRPPEGVLEEGPKKNASDSEAAKTELTPESPQPPPRPPKPAARQSAKPKPKPQSPEPKKSQARFADELRDPF